MEKTLIANNKNKESVSSFILMVLIMFVTDSPLFFLTINSKLLLFRTLFICGLPIIFLFKMCVSKEYTIDADKVVLFLMLSTSAIATLLISNDLLNAYILMISRLLLAILISILWSFEKFVDTFLGVLRVIAIISLVGYIACQINPLVVEYLPEVTLLRPGAGGVTRYATLFFYNVPKEFGEHILIRNFGAFWEPGAFAAYLNVGLYFIFFQKNKYKLRVFDVSLLMTTLVTTTSLGGIAAAVLLVIIYIFAPKQSGKKSGLEALVFLLSIVAVLYISGSEEFIELFSNRINPEGAYNGSTDSRWHSIMGNISIFFENPIFGVGIQSVDGYLKEYYISKGGIGDIIHNTNTMLIYFSSLGIVFGCIFLHLYYTIAVRSIKGTFFRLALFMCLFLMLANEDFTGSIFFTIIPMYALSKNAFKNNINKGDDENHEKSVMDKQLPFAEDKQSIEYSNDSE